MKTAELTGAALDWAVCKAKGEYQCPVDEYTKVWMASRRYSTDWLLGGPIIEREKIAVVPDEFSSGWNAHTCHFDGQDEDVSKGPTPLIAAMRCYVASVLGDTVDIPEELT
tara:strand:+ start:132 stop:464 length:333 start_codon:yes stop_codon:yes gene_type:complete